MKEPANYLKTTFKLNFDAAKIPPHPTAKTHSDDSAKRSQKSQFN